MRHLFSILFISLFVCLTAAELKPSIYIAPDAIPSEKNAAAELGAGLKRIFGIKVPVRSVHPEQCMFWVGQSDAVAKALEIKDFSELKPDEIILKSIDGRMLLLGERPRGPLYAVYEYLERAYGVRFWTADVEHWPAHEKFFLPAIELRHAPAFIWRDIYYDLVRKGTFSVKLHVNTRRMTDKWGGQAPKSIGGPHSLGQKYINAKKYFPIHPEWFALKDGRRVANRQHCMTNKEYRKALIQDILDTLRKEKDSRYVSVIQADGDDTFCECEECTRFMQEHGGKSDLLWDLVNEVAEAVEKEFPKVRVATAAYTITVSPPKTVIPRKNVVVTFTPASPDFSQAFDSPANAKNNSYFKAWRKLGNPMKVWTHETDFKHFYMPCPNWKKLFEDPKYFAENGVIGIFQQGSYAGPIADLPDLRIWVLGKLQWDTSLDAKALVKEFAEGYYGKAAPSIVEYIQYMTKHAKKGKNKMYRFDISGKELLDARKILLEGEMAVADNPVLHRRMQLALLPVNLALLQQPLLWEPLAPELAGIQWRPLMEEQLALIKDAKVVRLAEAPFTPDMLQHKIEMLLSWEKGAPPVPGYAAGTKWKQIAAVDCLRFKPYEFVDDPDALTGKAVEVECTHKTWTSQLWRPVTGTWDVYVDLQCTGDNPSGKTATFGFYDLEEKKNIQSGSVDAKDIAAPGYHLVKMGRLVSTGDQYLYCAPTINNSVKKLRISRYVFIKAE